MAETRRVKHCMCSKCRLGTDTDPESGEVVSGAFIDPSTWSRHRIQDESRKAQAPSRSSIIPRYTTSNTDTPSTAGDSPPLAKKDKGVSRTPKTVPAVTLDTPDIAPSQSFQVDDFALQDLMYYEKILRSALSSFQSPYTLEFLSPPSCDQPFVPSLTTTFPINSGPCALKRGQLDNESLLQFEEWLCQMHQAVSVLESGLPSTSTRTSLLPQILEGLTRIENGKELAWNNQRKNPLTKRRIVGSRDGALMISTARFLDMKFPSTLPQLVAFRSLVHCAVLDTSCHVSRERCNYFLNSLKDIVKETHLITGSAPSQRDKLLASIPSDIRTARSILRLDPILVKYVCCPDCRAMYPYDEEVQRASRTVYCTHKSVSQGDECGAPLYSTISESSLLNKTDAPRLIYLAQDFSQWLGKVLCRPGIEEQLRAPLKDLAKGIPSIIRTIWQGTIVRNFEGPDGKLFFQDLPGKLRLLFGFGYDNFNPFHNKQAGKKVSVGAMYFFLYNLPEPIRLRPENIFLAGVVHGPNQPELTELNHYLDPLITQFEIFFARGFFYPVTPDSPNGVLAQGCIYPLIMDLHALRQVTGTDPVNWPKWYTPTEHRRLAQMWLDAPTEDERERLFKEHYLRYSPLLRLPYFRADLMSSVEPMHAFQNIARNLVRNTWGIDHKNASGDGLFVGTRPKGSNSITPKQIVTAYVALTSKDVKQLNKTSRPVLYHLCEKHDLRRVGGIEVLRTALLDFYEKEPDQLKTDLQQAQEAAKYPETNNPETFKLRKYLATVTPDTSEDAITWLSKKPLPLLQTLSSECLEEGFELETLRRRQLAELIQLKTPFPFPSAYNPKGKAVLGADVISELDKDMKKTILPSWVATGPKEFDMSQHGKQSAAEWRTTVLVRLIITLPRIWGPRAGRARQMLDNFIHLTNAMIVVSTRAVVPSELRPRKLGTADLYRREYLAYLRGRVELYPTGTITPTEHFAYHLADKLESIGPIHIQSANVFERLNAMFQDIPSNMRMGELETTLMTKFCRSMNLNGLLNHPDAPPDLNDLRDSFNKTFGIEGGSMIQDALPYEASRFFYPHKKDLRPSQVATLDPAVEKLLISYLNSRYETDIYSAFGAEQRIWSVDRAQRRGIWYHKSDGGKRKEKITHKDSHILVKNRIAGKLRPEPYVIYQLFAMEYEPPGSEVTLGIFLVARRYLPLTKEDSIHDHWRRYPISGGRLYYNELDKRGQIFMIDDIVSHFAKTPFELGDIPGIRRDCIHVLPLFWHHMFDWLEYLSHSDEEESDE